MKHPFHIDSFIGNGERGVLFMLERKGRKGSELAVPGAALAAGGAASAMLAVFLVAVSALLASAGIVPERGLDGSVLAACGLGCLLGGRLSAAWGRRGGLLAGAAVGLAAASLLGLTGVLLYGGIDPERCAAVAAACLVGGSISGVMGRGGRGKRRK